MNKYISIILSVLVLAMIHPNGNNLDSGTEIYHYDWEGFDSIDGSATFEIEVQMDNEFSIEVIVDKSIYDRVKVEKRGNVLYLGVKTLSLRSNKTMKAIITMPLLVDVELSGAATMIAAGFKSEEDFDCELSGASSLELDIIADDLSFDLSGASSMYSVLEGDELTLEMSGASQVEIYGKSQLINVDGSSGVNGDLTHFLTKKANVELSGGSTFHLNIDGILNIDASGASFLYYTGNVQLGDVDLSGASFIKEE